MESKAEIYSVPKEHLLPYLGALVDENPNLLTSGRNEDRQVIADALTKMAYYEKWDIERGDVAETDLNPNHTNSNYFFYDGEKFILPPLYPESPNNYVVPCEFKVPDEFSINHWNSLNGFFKGSNVGPLCFETSIFHDNEHLKFEEEVMSLYGLNATYSTGELRRQDLIIDGVPWTFYLFIFYEDDKSVDEQIDEAVYNFLNNGRVYNIHLADDLLFTTPWKFEHDLQFTDTEHIAILKVGPGP